MYIPLTKVQSNTATPQDVLINWLGTPSDYVYVTLPASRSNAVS